MLMLNSRDLRQEIFKAVNDNPALEIVRDPLAEEKKSKSRHQREVEYSSNYNSYSGGDAQAALENRESYGETLQQHLMSQLNMINLSPDEYDLSVRLIYNLDKNGFYGSMLAPETLIDKARPLQNKLMLERCITRIQQMDPVGVCCKTLEESLFIQAKINGDAPQLALFFLDGHLDFLNPPNPERVVHKLNIFIQEYHKKSFGAKLILDNLPINQKAVEEALVYIQGLNPRPAGDYISDISQAEIEHPDVVLNVVRVEGHLSTDDFSSGKVATDQAFYFQVKYASGVLPEIRIDPSANFDKDTMDKAKAFLSNLAFRENTIALQGCAIVSNQKDFFMYGPGHIKSLTRKQIAQQLNIHESTVSRMSAKKSSKYIQTEWGLFPASYFFSSGVETSDAQKISAEVLKIRISKMIEEAASNGNQLSDNQITKLLNDEGIKIARRTVAKYRQNAGLNNSYSR